MSHAWFFSAAQNDMHEQGLILHYCCELRSLRVAIVTFMPATPFMLL